MEDKVRHFVTTVGSLVSSEQAARIIVKTQKYPLTVDFPDFVQLVDKYLGKVSTLPLEYLHNHRIGSKQGVRGWVGWSGRVGCELLELPTAGRIDPYTVSSDCKTIAAAFPFLAMRLQVYEAKSYKLDWSTSVQGAKLNLVGQWNIEDGKAEYLAPERTAVWLPKESPSAILWRRGLEADTIPAENYQLGAGKTRLQFAAEQCTD
jgi:hypothetical protein